jgi:hypothetical protein
VGSRGRLIRALWRAAEAGVRLRLDVLLCSRMFFEATPAASMGRVEHTENLSCYEGDVEEMMIYDRNRQELCYISSAPSRCFNTDSTLTRLPV